MKQNLLHIVKCIQGRLVRWVEADCCSEALEGVEVTLSRPQHQSKI